MTAYEICLAKASLASKEEKDNRSNNKAVETDSRKECPQIREHRKEEKTISGKKEVMNHTLEVSEQRKYLDACVGRVNKVLNSLWKMRKG